MARIRVLLAALAWAAAGFAAQPAAFAQGTSVIVIDQARIMRDSAGGQDIQTKLQAIGAQMQTELQPEAQALETEGQSIEARTANMTREAVAQDATLRGQIEAYARKVQAFQQKRQVRAQELQLTERAAWAQFFQELEPVLQEVVDESGAQLLVDRSNTIFATPAIDKSEAVIEKMNARLPTINVTRQRLPEQPEQLSQ